MNNFEWKTRIGENVNIQRFTITGSLRMDCIAKPICKINEKLFCLENF